MRLFVALASVFANCRGPGSEFVCTGAVVLSGVRTLEQTPHNAWQSSS